MRWRGSTRVKGLLSIALFVVSASALSAASYELKGGEFTYYLSTGTDGGECRVRDIASSATEVVCRDGEILAAASSVDGCLDSQKSGYCMLGVPQVGRESGSVLNCAAGKSYYIHTGIWDDNNCIVVGQMKSCMSTDRSSGAGASCKVGCENAIGSGVCCIMGANSTESCYTVNPPDEDASPSGE